MIGHRRLDGYRSQPARKQRVQEGKVGEGPDPDDCGVAPDTAFDQLEGAIVSSIRVGLKFVEFRIEPTRRLQFCVTSHFTNMAAFDHDDHIGHADC